jgi:hypothetical protein|uniref:Uncharacterized protein n=1 Tax=viral metagenome TaxID=1070528 RepID=A0A6C0LY43_9ZZZZ
MKKKFTITDFSPPPKMKRKKRFTRKELLQLEKNKKGKKKILSLQNIEKKRGFTIAELSHQPIIQKKIKRLSSPKQPKLKNTRFLIEDVILPPKYIKKTKTKFLIEDVILSPKRPSNSPPKPQSNSPPKPPSNSPPKPPSNSPPKRPSNSPSRCISGSPPSAIVQNPYCSCNGNCNWCQLHRLLEKSAQQIGKGIVTRKIRKRK